MYVIYIFTCQFLYLPTFQLFQNGNFHMFVFRIFSQPTKKTRHKESQELTKNPDWRSFNLANSQGYKESPARWLHFAPRILTPRGEFFGPTTPLQITAGENSPEWTLGSKTLFSSNSKLESTQMFQEGFPIWSMYGIFTYTYHKNQPNVGKYSIHGAYVFGCTSISSALAPTAALPNKYESPQIFNTNREADGIPRHSQFFCEEKIWYDHFVLPLFSGLKPRAFQPASNPILVIAENWGEWLFRWAPWIPMNHGSVENDL